MSKKNISKIGCFLSNYAPSYSKMKEVCEDLTPSQYINQCKEKNLIPDIHEVYIKIEEKTATKEDVEILLEDVVSSVEDRIQRRTRKNATAGHITHGGKQKLGGFRMSGRIKPKKSRSNSTQKHGRGKKAHERSTEKQRRNAERNKN